MESLSSLRTRTLSLLSEIALHKLVAVSELFSSGTGARNATPAGIPYNQQIANHMIKRDWTPEQIDNAVQYGDKIIILNTATNTAATRYIHPDTGRSVVIDNVSGEAIHVGQTGFVFREKPNSTSTTVTPGTIPVGTVGVGLDAQGGN